MANYSKEERQKLRVQWKDNLNEWKESGLGPALWCKAQDIPYSQFCYWKKKIFEKCDQVASQESFIEIPETRVPSTIEVRFEELTIQISKNFDYSDLQRCIQLLRNL